MRPSTPLALLGLLSGQALAACPYADQLASRSVDDAVAPRPVAQRADGKKGVFYM